MVPGIVGGNIGGTIEMKSVSVNPPHSTARFPLCLPTPVLSNTYLPEVVFSVPIDASAVQEYNPLTIPFPYASSAVATNAQLENSERVSGRGEMLTATAGPARATIVVLRPNIPSASALILMVSAVEYDSSLM